VADGSEKTSWEFYGAITAMVGGLAAGIISAQFMVGIGVFGLLALVCLGIAMVAD
jgi:hypothetical protein